MNITVLLNTFALYLSEYFHEELDRALKPIDSSGCTSCRSMNYDFIIVGAGAAGCILANRLSDNPNWNVLLIEAGGDEDHITDIPALAGLFTGTKYDWNYTTVKQELLCQDKDGFCKFPMGNVMGGSSTIGDMIYIRGNPKDYDEWAKLGNPGWSYKEVLPYFLKSENITLPDADTLHYHYAEGLFPISHGSFNSTIHHLFVKVGNVTGYEQIDYNGTYKVTMGFQMATKEGERRSSSKNYLNPIRDRKNLHVFKNTLVTKILLSNDAKRKAIGVVCVTDGQAYEVFSSKEVILSAGAINTPKLLMLSGIGPKKHLEELGIPVLADLPVGQNLIDHPGVIHHFRTNLTELIFDDTSLKDAILNYAKNKKGVFSASQWSIVGLTNINTEGSKNSDETGMYFGGYFLPDLTFIKGGKTLLIAQALRLLTTLSRGTVKLKSNDYNEPPIIDPQYFSNTEDLNHLIVFMPYVFAYFDHPDWAKYGPELIIPPQCNFNGTYTKEFLTCYLKFNSYIASCPTSTAKMGPVSDKNAVVDSNLKVHTIDSLRVVDASVVPIPIKGLPIATIDMIAEKASDIIRNDYI